MLQHRFFLRRIKPVNRFVSPRFFEILIRFNKTLHSAIRSGCLKARYCIPIFRIPENAIANHPLKQRSSVHERGVACRSAAAFVGKTFRRRSTVPAFNFAYRVAGPVSPEGNRVNCASNCFAIRDSNKLRAPSCPKRHSPYLQT